MKKCMKKLTAVLLTLAIALTSVLFVAPNITEAKAASGDICINPYYHNMVLTYKPGDIYTGYYTNIYINGCSKKSQIKSLKSTNKSVKLEAKDGYITAHFPKKAFKTTITCTVKGKKLKTTLTIKKYTNPLKVLKIDNTNFTKKLDRDDSYSQKKKFSNKKMSIQLKSGWKISSVYVYNNSSSSSWRNLNTAKFSKKISLTSSYAYVNIYVYNTKTGVSECLSLYRSNY